MLERHEWLDAGGTGSGQPGAHAVGLGEDRVPGRVEAAAVHAERAETRVAEGLRLLIGDRKQGSGMSRGTVGLGAVALLDALARALRLLGRGLALLGSGVDSGLVALAVAA